MMKRYIGDGVYAEHDGYALILTTENGYEVTNYIYLEPLVLAAFGQFLNDLKREALGDSSGSQADGG